MIPLATPPTPGPPTAHARGTATSARCLGLALAGLQLLAARPAPGTDWSAGADLGWRAARGPLEGAGRFDGWSYQDPRLADAHELAWEATARPLRTARSAGLVGWRHRTVGSAHTTLRSDLVVAGFRRALAPALAAQI